MRRRSRPRASSPVPAAIRPPCCSRCCRSCKAKLIEADDIIIDAKSGVSRRWPHAQAEHPLLGSGRGALALRHRQPPPRAGDRAGAQCRGRRPRHRQLHAASRAHEPGRAVHLLRPARRKAQGRRSPRRSGQGLCGEPLRACGGGRRDPGDPACARLELCHIGVFADRLEGRAIVVSAIDNLVKGSGRPGASRTST